MPKWYALWRWYVHACVWICPCGCTGPDCCTDCIWIGDVVDTEDERRTVTVEERFSRILYGGKP